MQYSSYVTELTYLLFLKMSEEQNAEGPIDAEYRWASLTSREGTELLQHYRKLLIALGVSKNESIKAIFANALSPFRLPLSAFRLSLFAFRLSPLDFRLSLTLSS